MVLLWDTKTSTITTTIGWTDPVFGILAGREDLEQPLAGKSTLNRMELGTGAKRSLQEDYFLESIGSMNCL